MERLWNFNFGTVSFGPCIWRWSEQYETEKRFTTGFSSLFFDRSVILSGRTGALPCDLDIIFSWRWWNHYGLSFSLSSLLNSLNWYLCWVTRCMTSQILIRWSRWRKRGWNKCAYTPQKAQASSSLVTKLTCGEVWTKFSSTAQLSGCSSLKVVWRRKGAKCSVSKWAPRPEAPCLFHSIC